MAPAADPPDAAMLALHAARILSDLTDAVIATDTDWRIVYLNSAAQALMPGGTATVLGRSLLDVLAPGGNEPLAAGLIAAKADGVPVALCAWAAPMNRWVEVHGRPGPQGCTVVLRDISADRDRDRAARLARREADTAQAINQRIFENSVDLILVVDRRGGFIRVSPSSLAILGYAPEEMVGRSGSDFVDPDDLESTRQEMRLARRGLLTRSFECRYVHKAGRPVTLAWTGLWSEREQLHFFIGHDMTERMVAEERLRRAQRLESVGQLTGGIAHDFNNMLSVVVGSLDLMGDLIGDQGEAGKLLDTALRASLKGAELTAQLLAFARRQTLDARRITVNSLVTSTLGMLSRTLGEQVEISSTLEDSLWPALADAAQFESALVNLSINARDAMAGSGRLSIQTANVTLDELYASENPEVTPGDYVMLAVTDNGPGMSREVLARAFDPFFTTKPVGKGSGLGLSMIYGFARQSRGHIKIYSELGHGTTVRLYLPRATDGAVAAEAARAVELPRAAAGEHVLLVEDNPDVRRVVAVQLADLGYRVSEAVNADDALHRLRRGGIDVLFTDVVLPGSMTGDALADAARADQPGLRVLLTSGFAAPLLHAGPRGAAFRHLLSKPYRKADLAVKLRAVLDDPD